jgi:putative ABC transport system substrate-binding protein
VPSILAVVMLFAVVVVADAQQPKVYFVGVLSLGSNTSSEINGLRDGLKQAGYAEGKNLILNIGVAKNYDELRPIVKYYIEKKFDVIVSSGASAPLIAKELTQHVPIMFIGAADPIQAGF